MILVEYTAISHSNAHSRRLRLDMADIPWHRRQYLRAQAKSNILYARHSHIFTQFERNGGVLMIFTEYYTVIVGERGM